MDETLYAQAQENRTRRDALLQRVNQAKEVQAKISVQTKEPLLITLPEHLGGGTTLLSHQTLYDALEPWIKAKMLRILELDTEFTRL
jgi:uncharacterized coiled-coil DUF342 family protein